MKRGPYFRGNTTSTTIGGAGGGLKKGWPPRFDCPIKEGLMDLTDR